MRAFLAFLVFIAFALLARWYYVCEIRGLCGEQKEEDVRLKTLSLKEGEEILLEKYDQFAFDSTSIRPRLNQNNRQFIDTVATILKAQENKSLTITAFYRVKEEGIKAGFFENLGIARAAEVRKLLMREEIEEGRVTLDYGISEDPELKEPLLLEMFIPSADLAKTDFTFTNMTFSDANFEFDSDVFKPGEPFLLYADSVKVYLEENAGSNLTIIGHTDNVGEKKYNKDLGMRRAKSAKDYFLELGVSAPIEIESLGETFPIASNNTSRGRQKNRRVNFVIKEGE